MTSFSILAKLRVLQSLQAQLWLTGGVAVDFMAGEWTRPHKDLDFIALTPERAQLEAELSSRAFHLVQDGSWLTRWSFSGDSNPAGSLEFIFVEPAEPETGRLQVPAGDSSGAQPGTILFPPGALNPGRFVELEGQGFRVCSAEYELFARRHSLKLFPGRQPEHKVLHDMAILERLISRAGA